MKFSHLTEALDIFPEIEKLEFDPDRADPYDVAHKLLPLLVKMAYVGMLEARTKHQKLYDHPDDEKFKFTKDELADRTEDLIKSVCDRFNDLSHSDVVSQVKHLQDKLPEKLE